MWRVIRKTLNLQVKTKFADISEMGFVLKVINVLLSTVNQTKTVSQHVGEDHNVFFGIKTDVNSSIMEQKIPHLLKDQEPVNSERNVGILRPVYSLIQNRVFVLQNGQPGHHRDSGT